MTTIDPGAVRAWARYEDGREALRRLLEQVHDATLAHTQQELKRYRSGLKPPDLAAAAPGPLFPRGLYEVRFGLSVPAAYTEQSLQVACWPEDGVPYLGLVVIPRDGAILLDEGNRKLQRHVKALLDAGFIPNVGPEPSWYASRSGSSYCLERRACSASRPDEGGHHNRRQQRNPALRRDRAAAPPASSEKAQEVGIVAGPRDRATGPRLRRLANRLQRRHDLRERVLHQQLLVFPADVAPPFRWRPAARVGQVT